MGCSRGEGGSKEKVGAKGTKMTTHKGENKKTKGNAGRKTMGNAKRQRKGQQKGQRRSEQKVEAKVVTQKHTTRDNTGRPTNKRENKGH